MNEIILFIYLFSLSLPLCISWREWDYKVQYSTGDLEDQLLKQSTWYKEWYNGVNSSMNPDNQAPGARRGHTLVLIEPDSFNGLPPFTKKGEVYILMFGGRGIDGISEHIPKTYEVDKVNGKLNFTTYDQKPLNPCFDIENKYFSKEQQINCASQTKMTNVSHIFNDVWGYKLCNYPERDWDEPCADSGWVIWHPGAREGGCVIELGIEVCNVPSERYNHDSVAFHDGTMFVYGGYSQRCADYCDDMWLFDVYMKSWRQVYAANTLTHLKQEIWSFRPLSPYLYSEREVPADNCTDSSVCSLSNPHRGPGKRWRHTMTISKPRHGTDLGGYEGLYQDVIIFGGFRLWHGYTFENSESNLWENFNTLPKGGYLSDMWVYTKLLDYTSIKGLQFRGNDGKWKYIWPMEQCESAPGLDWESRFDQTCSISWPLSRAGHGSAYDQIRNRVWIYGGYNTYFPYLSTDSSGSGAGVSSIASGGFVPYPQYPYFLNDLWYYSFEDSIWHQVRFPIEMNVPTSRSNMVFFLLEDELFLHGGFVDGNYLDDTWYFNITSLAWLRKDRFIYPIYPETCTDDMEYIEANNCTHLLWPKYLVRAQHDPFRTLPYDQQDFYWPDTRHGPQWPSLPKDTDKLLNSSYLQSLAHTRLSEGSPIFPYSATGPLQYEKKFFYQFNSTMDNVTLYEQCTSVFGEPTRGHKLDGLYGRSNNSIFIAQPRRRAPGWDGCRDRYDKRSDLPHQLQYIRPLARGSHRAVFNKNTSEIFMYGGQGYQVENPMRHDVTFGFHTKHDMWYYNLFHCIKNCSGHGDCYYGFCQCDVGYYGEDCSNSSCPGTFCSYDPVTHEQSCSHACSAGYQHQDNDQYVQDIAKLPCTPDNPGESNGICDGFGSTQCAPPFIGYDCSIKDCKNNCSFNGWCSVEYPVSRCMCIPGYYGDICQYKLCLNNCSYPNGVCDPDTGQCACRMTYSPYINTREYKPWGGEDCSFLFAYAGAHPRIFFSSFWSILSSLFVVLLVMCLFTENMNNNIQPNRGKILI